MYCTVDIIEGLYDVCALGLTVVAIAVSDAINFNKENTTTNLVTLRQNIVLMLRFFVIDLFYLWLQGYSIVVYKYIK